MTCGRDDPPGYTCAGSKVYVPCGQHFGALDTFDWHFRPVSGKVDAEGLPVVRCATPKELERHGLHLDDNRVWRTQMDEETAARLRASRPAKAQPLDALAEAMKGG